MNKIKGIMNLPSKVTLKKTTVDIEETDKAAERMHTLEEPVVEMTLNVRSSTGEVATKAAVREKVRKKTTAPKPRKASPTPPLPEAEKPKSAKGAVPATDVLDEPTTRITLDLPASIYKAAKIKSFTEMMTLRSYIIDLLRDDLNI